MVAADYSYARPGGAALRAAGITDVGRYLAPPGDGRALELPEYQDLRAHGINVWVNREGAATDMLLGYAKGLYHGQTAAANLGRLGLDPKTTVVYASADFDAQPGQFPVMDAYLDGFTAGLGSSPDYTGTYGSMPWINHCRATGKAKWFWQSASTSFTHGQTGFVHIQQTTLPSMSGTDNDILYAAEYGQIGVPVPAGGNPQPFNPQENNMPLDANTDYAAFSAMLYRALKWDVRDGNLGAGADAAHGATMWDLLHGLANSASTMQATVAALQGVTLTDAQMQALEAAVVAGIEQSGVTLPQAERDAIATAVRANITANPFTAAAPIQLK